MLSIIIPSYNGSDILQKELPAFIAYLEKEIPNYEIIVVDDGSENWEKTQQVAKENKCRFERNQQNQGKGAAVKRGVFAAKGDQIIFTDADIPFQYQNLNRLYQELQGSEKEVVIGDRTLPESDYYDGISTLRRMGSKVFTSVISWVLKHSLRDTQCGLKGFKRQSAEAIFNCTTIKGFAFDVELLIITQIQERTIARIPVQLRNTGGSSVNFRQEVFKMLKDVFQIKRNSKNGKYE